jgi:hypothetical protein
VVQTGSQQRSNVFGQFRQSAEIIRSGRLGKIQTVTVGVGGPSVWCDLKGEDMEPGLEWDLWLGPAPQQPYSSVLSPRGMHNHFPAWRSYREYSGGGHTDMGAHHYDIAFTSSMSNPAATRQHGFLHAGRIARGNVAAGIYRPH